MGLEKDIVNRSIGQIFCSSSEGTEFSYGFAICVRQKVDDNGNRVSVWLTCGHVVRASLWGDQGPSCCPVAGRVVRVGPHKNSPLTAQQRRSAIVNVVGVKFASNPACDLALLYTDCHNDHSADWTMEENWCTGEQRYLSIPNPINNFEFARVKAINTVIFPTNVLDGQPRASYLVVENHKKIFEEEWELLQPGCSGSPLFVHDQGKCKIAGIYWGADSDLRRLLIPFENVCVEFPWLFSELGGAEAPDVAAESEFDATDYGKMGRVVQEKLPLFKEPDWNRLVPATGIPRSQSDINRSAALAVIANFSSLKQTHENLFGSMRALAGFWTKLMAAEEKLDSKISEACLKLAEGTGQLVITDTELTRLWQKMKSRADNVEQLLSPYKLPIPELPEWLSNVAVEKKRISRLIIHPDPDNPMDLDCIAEAKLLKKMIFQGSEIIGNFLESRNELVRQELNLFALPEESIINGYDNRRALGWVFTSAWKRLDEHETSLKNTPLT